MLDHASQAPAYHRLRPRAQIRPASAITHPRTAAGNNLELGVESPIRQRSSRTLPPTKTLTSPSRTPSAAPQLPRTRARPPTFTRPRPSETISLPIATGCRPQPRRPPRPAATMVLSGTRRPTAKRRRGAPVCAKTDERSQFLWPVCRSRLFNINKLQFFPPLLRKFLTNEAASLPVIEKAPSYLSIPTSPGQANEATTSAASRVAVSIENQAHPRPGPL
jgi:hypothetical protein